MTLLRKLVAPALAAAAAVALARYAEWRIAHLPPLELEGALAYIALAGEMGLAAALALTSLMRAWQRRRMHARPVAEAAIAPETDVILIDTGEALPQVQLALAAAHRLAPGARRLRVTLAVSAHERARLAELRRLAEGGGAALSIAAAREPEALFRTALAETDAPLVLALTTAHVAMIDALTRSWTLFRATEHLAGVNLQRFTADLEAPARTPEPSLRMPRQLGDAMRLLADTPADPMNGGFAPTVWRRSALINAGVLRNWEAPVAELVSGAGMSVAASAQPAVAEAIAPGPEAWFAVRVAHLRDAAGFRMQTVLRQSLSAAAASLAVLSASLAAALVAGAPLWPADRDAGLTTIVPAYAAFFVLFGLASDGVRRRWHRGFVTAAEGFLLTRGAFAATATAAALGCFAGSLRLLSAPSPDVAGGFAVLAVLACGLVACAAFGVAHEPAERRAAPRRAAVLNATLHLGGFEIPGRVVDVSLGGARFVAVENAEAPDAAGVGLLRLVIAQGAPEALFRVRVRTVADRQGARAFGLALETSNHAEFADAVTLAFGAADPYLDAADAARWVKPLPAFAMSMALRGAEAMIARALARMAPGGAAAAAPEALDEPRRHAG